MRQSDDSFTRNRVSQRTRNRRNNSKRPRKHGKLLSRIQDLEERPFIAWDGEGYREFVCGPTGEIDIAHHYMLFGNSDGQTIHGRSLSSEECFALILDAERRTPHAIHVIFGGGYDANMWLRDLEWRHLGVLYDAGKVKWRGYRLSHVPGKSFTVSKDGVSATVYDVFGFFHSGFLPAIKKYNVGTAEQHKRIQAGKSLRSRFTLADLPYAEEYFSDELSLLVDLMEIVRESVYSSGFYITEWHGPGALASYALKQNGFLKYKGGKNVPAQVKVARLFAYAGGRFQPFRGGLYLGPVYTADINSAYAYAGSLLPRLDNGQWETIDPASVRQARDIARFGLYRIRLEFPDGYVAQARIWGIPFPLFHRSKKGNLSWPHRTEGWYWSPEAATVIGSPYATVLEAIVYRDDGTYPFSWIADAFARRLQLQRYCKQCNGYHEGPQSEYDHRPSGHPAEKAYKWMLAAMYGQWAQRVGWDKLRRIAPRSHQLEWAGYVTSYCRAMVFRAALCVGRRGGLISIDTDGITSMVPFEASDLPNGTGELLGQWKLEEYTGIFYWQNGIYWLRKDDGTWVEPKTRGIPKGDLSIDAALACYAKDGLTTPGNSRLRVHRKLFVGYGLALSHQWQKWRHWFDTEVEIIFGGKGKAAHVPALCPKCSICYGIPMHLFTQFPPDDTVSEPHYLPWLYPDPEKDLESNSIEYIMEDLV